MAAKYVILFVTLLVGSLAIPTPEIHDDMSFFFDEGSRIVGGTQAAAGSHPHMVALTTGSIFTSLTCGGSLVSPRTVLTAAHCIDAVYSRGQLISSLRAVVGTTRWSSGGQSYTLLRNVTHPNYVSQTIKNDIGVLITRDDVTQSNSNLVQPIALTYDNVGGGEPAIVAGWGGTRTSGTGSPSAVLMELLTTTISGPDCVNDVETAAIALNTRAPPVEPHIEICTFHAPSFGTCRGDSGSALLRVADGKQIGVVSWGFPCARGAPDMFARVSGFRDWLGQSIV